MLMSTQKSGLDLKLSKRETKDLLKKYLRGKHSDLLADAILGLIPEEDDRKKLFQAALGMKQKVKYAVGDEIWVYKTELTLVGFDFEAMERVGYMINGWMKATIHEINVWSPGMYTIHHLLIGNGSRPHKIVGINKDGRQYTLSHCSGKTFIPIEKWPE